MALTPEQYARLMSGVTAKARAKTAGIPVNTRAAHQATAFVDAHNTAVASTERRVEAFLGRNDQASQGIVSLAGAPRTLAQSGLAAEGFNFDDSQLAALEALINGEHVCLIGAAGTGKTTMVKHALASLIYGGEGVNKPLGIRNLGGEQGPSIAIAAFTGIASHVIRSTLPSWLSSACKTIHTLLEYKPSDNDGKMFEPTRTATNKLDHDIIVIDEASMLGLDLWHKLIDALRPHTRVILIGDLNQLKPVADATMFAYALSAGLDKEQGWTLAELTTIHRQKEPAANRIIDTAHAILNGKVPEFDTPSDPNWRVIGYEIPPQAEKAHNQIVAAIDWLRKQPTPGNPERALYDPYQDLTLCAGNGYEENDSACLVQQSPLNGTLARVIEPVTLEHPMYIIDAGRDSKKLAVGHRVMATKNESPAKPDRVTNGMTGRVISIEPNKAWSGNRAMFGTEMDVMDWRKKQAIAAREQMNGESVFKLGMLDTSKIEASEQSEEKQASHIVEVEYVTGAKRVYKSAAEVAGIQLAYAMTVHKAQGSQCDTLVIICHHAVKGQLSREWLYTGVTRARRRVVVLYTSMGIRSAVSKQQIYGATMRDKVERYRQVMASGRQFVRLRAREKMVEHETEESA